MPDRRKLLRANRERGISYWIDASATRERIAVLKAKYGMSDTQIGTAAGLNPGHVSKIRNENHRHVSPEVAQRIASAKPPLAPATRLQGARRPIIGCQRRIDAMTLEGWTVGSLSSLGGVSKRGLQLIMSGVNRHGVTPDIWKRIDELYRRTQSMSASQYGITDARQRHAVHAAALRNAAPRHCWDDDTIDDPDSIAEWTGECGTEAGYRIHEREEGAAHWRWNSSAKKSGRWVIGCAPCRAANAARKLELRKSR